MTDIHLPMFEIVIFNEVLFTEAPTTTITAYQPAPTTMTQTEMAPTNTSMTRIKQEASSSLSALLVPGGQISAHRPLGRSTITKVASPILNPVAEHYQNDKVPASDLDKLLPEFLSNDYKKGFIEKTTHSDTATKLLEQASSIDETAKITEDNAFNWYFQHYNDTNLEPYVGIVENGAGRGNIFVTFSTVACLVFSRLV